MERRIAPPAGARQVTPLIRRRVQAAGERLWRLPDFRDLPPQAVAKAFSRLAREGFLQRLSKGVYYRTRPTAFGKSLPNPAALRKLASRTALPPALLRSLPVLGRSPGPPC